MACQIVGEETAPEIISSNRLELKSIGKLSDRNITLLVSMVTSNESENSTKSALQLLDDFESKTIQQQKELYRQWWKNFWEQSFVYLENNHIENIYYLCRYLMVSSSQGKFPVVFNGGL